MTQSPDIVIDVFNGAIECLSTLLDTTVGGWIGGCIIVIALFRIIKQFQNI